MSPSMLVVMILPLRARTSQISRTVSIAIWKHVLSMCDLRTESTEKDLVYLQRLFDFIHIIHQIKSAHKLE